MRTTGWIDDNAPGPVDDHDVSIRLVCVTNGNRAERRRVAVVPEHVFRERSDRPGIPLEPTRDVTALVACVGDAQRHLQRDEDDDREREIAEEKPAAHGSCNRKPTPRTASIQAGSPSLRRSDAMCTSIVFVWPYHVTPQIRSSSSLRVTTASGSAASSDRSSNSFPVSTSSLPSSR